MKYEFKLSFDRSIKSLAHEEKQNIKDICLAFIDLIERQTKLPLGIGLKHLHSDYWEIRKGLRCRILFSRQYGLIQFLLAGNHDSIRRFLKSA